MSTRYLRKVYGTDGFPTENREDDTADNHHPPNSDESKLYNLFDLLNENSESGERGERSSGDDEVDSQICKRRKKKKKRKKATATDSVRNDNDEDIQDADEIERTVREVNKLLGEPAPGGSAKEDDAPIRSKESILAIKYNRLNPYDELKRICGGKNIQAKRTERHNRGRYTSKNRLVVAHRDWSPVGQSGLSVTTDSDFVAEGGVKYYLFAHGQSYRNIQKEFLKAVDSQNPENIIAIMNAYPNHIDTLLQLSDLCKLNEDLQKSAELVERALYIMESALHPLFNITSGKCRLSYKKQTNRAFFIALFKHMMFVGGRACYRTSLEFCKLLLTLDPENDPLAVVLAIDFYALRSRKYEWFIEFCQLWEESRNLTQLPNIAYGLALAHFHNNDSRIADELLQNALFMFPGVFVPLLEKCAVEMDSKLTGHDYFISCARSSTSRALEKLQQLYVARSHHLWKESGVLSWLEAAARHVTRRVDARDDYVEYCRTKRAKRYQGQPPRSILRHIFLSDFKEVTISHYAGRNADPIFSYDPLPPADSIDVYQRRTTIPRPARTNSNLFSLFVSSLYTDLEGNIPNIALNGFERDDDDGNGDEID